MPKRTTYKKSKKQRKTNNNTRYRKSKSQSKRAKAGGLYTCKNNIVSNIAKGIRTTDGYATAYTDPEEQNVKYECKRNVNPKYGFKTQLHRNNIVIPGANSSDSNYKYFCDSNGYIRINATPVSNIPSSLYKITDTYGKTHEYECKNNVLYYDGEGPRKSNISYETSILFAKPPPGYQK